MVRGETVVVLWDSSGSMQWSGSISSQGAYVQVATAVKRMMPVGVWIGYCMIQFGVFTYLKQQVPPNNLKTDLDLHPWSGPSH
jgi:hypothetical protein